MGKKVIVIGGNIEFPEVHVDCPMLIPPEKSLDRKCFARRTMKSTSPDFPLIEKINHKIKTLTRLHGGKVTYWELNDHICSFGWCSTYYRGVKLFGDVDHFTYAGGALVAQDIVETLGVPFPIACHFN